MRRLEEKIVLITGAGNGIGRASAIRFATEGAYIVAADIAVEAAAETAMEIRRAGGQAKSVGCDVSKEDDVRATTKSALSVKGRIDVLFNCAGGGATAGGGAARDGSVTELDLNGFWRAISVDLYGTLLFCRHVIPEMSKKQVGSIINMTSLRALIGTQGADGYTAAKGGVLSMTRAMASQYAANGIRVNAIAPGVVSTERVKALISEDDPIYKKSLLGPVNPEEVAALAAYLASDESQKVTGTVMRLDGGASAV